MRNKRGFTLIELLAVIVILAIIALISTPLILNAIDEATKGAFKDSAYGIVQAGELGFTQDILNGITEEVTYTYTNGVETSQPEGKTLNYKGNKPENGMVKINTEGKVAISIHNGKYCAEKGYDETKITLSEKTTGECVIINQNQTPAEVFATDTILENISDSIQTTESGLIQTTEENYRYVGANPNNYISFNNELWRIIGVFQVKNQSGDTETRLKIIRSDSIGDLVWDSGNVSDWSNASLQNLLNSGDYYNRTGSYATTGLTDTAKSQISPVVWNLGGFSATDMTVEQIYSQEIGTTVYTGMPTEWVGEIAVMYPSDYGFTYANNTSGVCYNDLYNCDTDDPSAGWLYNNQMQWTLMNCITDNFTVLYVYTSGYINVHNPANVARGVRPVTFLKSDIKIASGTGTSSDPYIIG